MNSGEPRVSGVLNLRAGERVRVKSREDILATLDEGGMHDRLPFMPEMLQHCGREFTVFKRADKTCDTIEKSGARRMMDAVHLDGSRCDGSAHGGCGARCLMFWKEAWLERTAGGQASAGTKGAMAARSGGISPPIKENRLMSLTTRPSAGGPDAGEVYSCQVTELLNATTPLPSTDLGQYVRDVRSGNIGVGAVLSAFAFRTYQRILTLPGMKVWLALYDGFQRLRGGVPFPYRQGRLVGKTPAGNLNLQPGELVKVRSYEEILDTLDTKNRNRGLWFDCEQVPFCGKTARVLCRVEKIINEKTGKMMKLPNDCLILEGVYCQAHYSSDRLFCPRSIFCYWREAWLKRIDQ